MQPERSCESWGRGIVLSSGEKGQREVLTGFAQNLLQPNVTENKAGDRSFKAGIGTIIGTSLF